MLSNNYYKLFWILSILLFVSNCGKKNQPVNLNDERAVKNIAEELLGKEIKFSSAGYFSSDSAKSIIAGTEISDKNQQGIKFSLIEEVGGEFRVVYDTGLLNGSFEKCLVDRMKFSSSEGEMIYYNSQDYFLGTAGGDIYSYVIDFVKKEVYYAHLVVHKSTQSSLYLSENVQDPLLRKFFISYFKKDYGALNMLKSDVL